MDRRAFLLRSGRPAPGAARHRQRLALRAVLRRLAAGLLNDEDDVERALGGLAALAL